MSALGARMIPTQTSTDVAVQQASIKDSEGREEIRRSLEALRTELGNLKDHCNNELLRTDLRLQTLEKNLDKKADKE